jgi:hypothetical protein
MITESNQVLDSDNARYSTLILNLTVNWIKQVEYYYE